MLQSKISDGRKDITGDSFIVDVRTLRNRKAGVFYVLGHISSKTKAEETWEGVPEWRKREFEGVVKHRYLIQPFGVFFGAGSADSNPFECPKCGCTKWIFLWVERVDRERVTLLDWVENNNPPPGSSLPAV